MEAVRSQLCHHASVPAPKGGCSLTGLAMVALTQAAVRLHAAVTAVLQSVLRFAELSDVCTCTPYASGRTGYRQSPRPARHVIF